MYIDVSDCQSGSEDETKEGGGRSSEGPREDVLIVLQQKLKELTTAYELVVQNSHQLSKFASEQESGGSAGKPKEEVALLKITSTVVVKVR